MRSAAVHIEPFVHTPLPDFSTQIRLLRLLPHHLTDRVLQYELGVCELDRAPKHRAVSYTWGGALYGKMVLINQAAMRVRLSCHYALCQVARHMPDSWIWIDSICINQADIAEKNAQVQMIGRIYLQAGVVAASLGPQVNGSERICNYRDAVDLPRTARDWLHQYRYDKLLDAACEAFAERSTWKRLWIVQEPFLAQYVWLLCGGDAITAWKDTHERLFLQRGKGKVRDALEFAHDSQFKRILDRKKEWNYVTNQMTVLKSIIYFEGFQCQDPQDKVFALLNISRTGHEQMHVDYSVPLERLASRVARHALKSTLSSADARKYVADVRKMFKVLGVPDTADRYLSRLVNSKRFRKAIPNGSKQLQIERRTTSQQHVRSCSVQ